MAGSGYGAKTTGITGNTTGMGEEVLKVAAAGAVLQSKGAPAVTVGANGEDFQCVDTSKLTDLTGKLKESDYACSNPTNPKQTFKAKVEHGPR